MTNSNILYAVYEVSTEWDLEKLGIDLNAVEDWTVKWDTLRVKRTKDSEWEEINPISSADLRQDNAEIFCLEHPDQLWLDGVRVDDIYYD
jgi:hypothetical protein